MTSDPDPDPDPVPGTATGPAADPVIRLIGAYRSYTGQSGTVEALRRTDLSVAAGDYLAIMGPSGSGKSTLLNTLGLLDAPTGGSYLLDGHETARLSEADRTVLRGRHLGFVFQAFHLLPYRTAAENVELGMLYGGVKPAERRERAHATLARVGLTHRADAFPPALSGGERQRVAVARALVGRPQVLLCDEPTGSLDNATSGAVMDLIGELHEAGLTTIVVTHDPAVASRAGRRFEIADGTLREVADAAPTPA